MNTLYRLVMSPDAPWYVIIFATICAIIGVIVGALNSEVEYRKEHPVQKRYQVDRYAMPPHDREEYNWLWLAKLASWRIGCATVFDTRTGLYIDPPQRW